MKSLRRRLLVGAGLAISLAFTGTGVLVLVLARAALVAQLDDNLVAQTVAMSALVEQEGDALESELGPTISADRGVYYELWDGAGRVVERSPNLGEQDLVRTEGVASVELPGGSAGRQVMLHFEPRHDEPASRPLRATLVVARSTEGVDDSIQRVGFVLVGSGIAGTIACLLALLALVRFGLAPVRTLADRIAQIRATDLSARLNDDATPAELRPIVERLDEMLARVAAAFSRERELTAEVAHELRTPLAGLRATIEVTLDRERSADRYRSALAECLAITIQTERMVAALLSLARLDAGNIHLAPAPIAIDDLVREVISTHDARVTERGLTISTRLAPITQMIDREQLRIVVDNLVDNATSYASAGSTIDVVLTGRELVVANDGCTLVPADAAKTFERFWRGESARTSRTNAGLGLAICKKIVELLGGTIDVEIAGGRFRVTVRFAS